MAAILLLVVGFSILRIIPLDAAHAGSKHGNATTTPIQHIVVIMLENHTFDNYFGRYTCPTGDSNCDKVDGVTLPRASDPVRSDFNHNAAATNAAVIGGKTYGYPARSQVQYTQLDIPIYWNYATQFGLSDNFFASMTTSSSPNHMVLVTAQNGGVYETGSQSGCLSAQNDLSYSKKIPAIPTGPILATMLITCRRCSNPIIVAGATMLQLVSGMPPAWYSHCTLHLTMYTNRDRLFRMSNQATWRMYPGSRHLDTTGAIIPRLLQYLLKTISPIRSMLS